MQEAKLADEPEITIAAIPKNRTPIGLRNLPAEEFFISGKTTGPQSR
jgi:hypothetical protein